MDDNKNIKALLAVARHMAKEDISTRNMANKLGYIEVLIGLDLANAIMKYKNSNVIRDLEDICDIFLDESLQSIYFKYECNNNFL